MLKKITQSSPEFKNFLCSPQLSRTQGTRLYFSCSTQLNMKFIMHINVKMSTIVAILTFISMINTTLETLKARKNTRFFQHFRFYEQLKFYGQLTGALRKVL